ncbi:hypothetical protein Fmac_020777 [Flemingia macrophylla]|uniref:Uncharacterized protein n=1 Tax=Flemingia macrophylla TaxID=520843 RepID=A0ABD1LWS1_9FABA
MEIFAFSHHFPLPIVERRSRRGGSSFPQLLLYETLGTWPKLMADLKAPLAALLAYIKGATPCLKVVVVGGELLSFIGGEFKKVFQGSRKASWRNPKSLKGVFQAKTAILSSGFYGRFATPGYRRRPWGDLVVPTGIPNEETLREPPTPTTVHVRSILIDVLDNPSLS